MTTPGEIVEKDRKCCRMEMKRKYCTISIDSAWGVTCDQMDEILTTSNVGVTWDKV